MSAEALAQPEIPQEQAFTEFVFKLSSRCNMQPPSSEDEATLHQLPVLAQGGIIGCDQCYEYAGNTAWKEQPHAMSLEVVQQAALRIAEHARQNNIEDIRIIAHGGEPLMMSADYLDQYATILRSTIGSANCNVHLSIQTNGLLLTDRKLDALLKHGFSIGLSLDGDKLANDLHRRDKMGRSTYDRAIRAAKKLDEHGADWGIITVIDTDNDPEKTLESLAALRPKSIKLHPPHANWSSPPKAHPDSMSLGEWQVRAFERYRQWSEFHPDQEAPPFSLHLATDYIDAFLGATPTDERVSNRYPHELFFLPSGDIQRLDTLKVTETWAYKTNFNVFDHSLNEVARTDPGFMARRMGTTALASECQSCEFVKECGGDYYPLRFKQTAQPLSEQSGPTEFAEAFRNPSIYCADQKQFLGHIAAFVEGQKRAIANIPVDISATWRGHAGYDRDDDYLQGIHATTSIYANMPLRGVSGLMGAFDNAAGIIRPKNRLEIGKEDQLPPIDAQQAQQLREHIQNGNYSGLGALLALAWLHKQEMSDDVLYFQAGSTARTRREDFRLAQGISSNKYDAVVQALFDPDQVLLHGLEFGCLQVGGQWLVTKNAVEARARFADMSSASFVSALSIPPQYSDMLAMSIPSIDVEHFIARLQPYIAPVRVGYRDLPHNLLVVDVPDAPSGVTVRALHDIADMMGRYNNPYQLASMAAERQISLLPLRGTWFQPHDLAAKYLVSGPSEFARHY